MAGVSPTSSSSSSASDVTYGTDVAPISFPGIASGIDYNSIINKLSAIAAAPNTQYQAEITKYDSQNAELAKINSLLVTVQNSLQSLSDPALYSAIDATTSDPTVATATSSGETGTHYGSYVVESQQTATSTTVVNNPIANTVLDPTKALAVAGTAIEPTDGTGSSGGKLTINGTTISYDVATDSVNTIISKINAIANVTASYNAATGVFSIADSAGPLSIGSAGDSGNLLDVLRLTSAQVNNTTTSGSVTGIGSVGGISDTESFGSAGNAGFATAVTAGSFTINGVIIKVTAANNLNDILTDINQSSAGVIATYDSTSGQISLANQNGGPQSIVLGASGDSSNFLTAAGLTNGSTTLGTQASVSFLNSAGALTTVYSNTNTISNIVPGVTLDLATSTNTPYTVTVNQDSTQLASAIAAFACAYNTAITEINNATAPPIVEQSTTNAASDSAPLSSSVGGGILFGNTDVLGIKDELVNIVSGLVPDNGTGYNSLSTIGLELDSSFAQLVANSTSVGNTSTGSTTSNGTTTADTNPIVSQTFQGTSGQFSTPDVTTLQNALAANASAVDNIFNGSDGVVNQLANYLTNVTGSPTLLNSGLATPTPTVSLLQSYEDANNNNISSLQSQIAVINDSVNLQANALRAEFTSSETQISQYQALQSQLSSFFAGH